MISRKLLPFVEKAGLQRSQAITIFDVGARDCKESLELLGAFPAAKVVAFECNPQTLPLCEAAVAKANGRLTLVAKAVNSYTGTCTFYPINPAKTRTTWPDGNPGASSLFRSNGTYTAETYVQDTIEVPCTTLEDACKSLDTSGVDVIWMDLQGAELLALKSLGPLLSTVKLMCLEVSHKPIYSGQVLYPELNAFLVEQGFQALNAVHPTSCWQEDIVYARRA